jgi:hypothetical protein
MRCTAAKVNCRVLFFATRNIHQAEMVHLYAETRANFLSVRRA